MNEAKPLFKKGQKVVDYYDNVSTITNVAKAKFYGGTIYKYQTKRYKPLGFLSPAMDIERWYKEGELYGIID